MLESVLDLGPGRHAPVPHRARHRRPDQPGPARAARHRRPGPVLRAHRPLPRADGPRRRRASPSTSAAWPSRARTTSRSSSTGAPRWPSPSTGPPGLDPQGLARRRHLAVRGRTVLGLEDEYFGRPRRQRCRPRRTAGRATARDGRRRGRGCWPTGWCSVARAPCSPRSVRRGPARWATSSATIQREQDEIIRSPLAGVLVVQGGPGTGKTAVALHRAAYLLYTHRFPLERQGVLVVGPNPLFLRYIEQVLPSLGETGVTPVDGRGARARGAGARRRRPRRRRS